MTRISRARIRSLMRMKDLAARLSNAMVLLRRRAARAGAGHPVGRSEATQPEYSIGSASVKNEVNGLESQLAEPAETECRDATPEAVDSPGIGLRCRWEESSRRARRCSRSRRAIPGVQRDGGKLTADEAAAMTAHLLGGEGAEGGHAVIDDGGGTGDAA